MGMLVIKFRGTVVSEVNLKAAKVTIGRNPACDIVLKDDKRVSNLHAEVVTAGRNSTVRDLNSRNGTFVETARVSEHVLKHGESIIVGEHELIFRDGFTLTSAVPGAQATPAAAPAAKAVAEPARLRGVEGAEKGKNLPLVKEETRIENPGKNAARIYRTAEGFVLHAEIGPGEPRLNDRPVQPGGQILEDGDTIEVAGTRYRFFA